MYQLYHGIGQGTIYFKTNRKRDESRRKNKTDGRTEILEALKMLKSTNKTKTFYIYCICCMYLFILIISL